MFQKLIKKHNNVIQKAVSEAISDGLRHELSNMKRLEGEKLQNFVNVFNIQLLTEPEIYYNNFNVLFCDEPVYEQMLSFIRKDSLVARVSFPKINISIWVHEIFQDALLSNFFDDAEQI